MQGSKDYMKQNDIVGRISFKESPLHIVKLLKDKIDTVPDQNGGAPVQGVKYLVEEKGEKKTFFTSSDTLIQKLSDYPEGSMVQIEMKSKKGAKGFISFFEVFPAGQGGAVAGTHTDAPEEVPSIQIEDLPDNVKPEDF